jgi:hypothetical protein
MLRMKQGYTRGTALSRLEDNSSLARAFCPAYMPIGTRPNGLKLFGGGLDLRRTRQGKRGRIDFVYHLHLASVRFNYIRYYENRGFWNANGCSGF